VTSAGRAVPTAAKNWQLVRAVLGFVRRGVKDGLLDADAPTAASLAIFACPSVVLEYANFVAQRSNDTQHGGVLAIAQFAKSLVHPQTGYLTQKREFAAVLGIEPQAWPGICAKAFAAYRESVKRMQTVLEQSRNPWDPIKQFVALPVPIVPIVEGLREFERDIRLMPEGSVARAVAFRDLLLMRFLVSNPLRIQNFREMTYLSDNSGNLYRTADGKWRLRFDPSSFKNFAGAAKGKQYDTEVDESLAPLLDEWFADHKPLVDPHDGSRVFMSVRRPKEAWDRPEAAVRAVTRRYVKGCTGLGPHSLRHLVATTFLKLAPGQYQHVALLLHDELETVNKHYAHLRADDGLSRWKRELGKIARHAA
jgi:integrase